MEKSSRRNSNSYSYSQSRPLSNVTSNLRPFSTATDDDLLPNPQPILTSATNTPPITVLQDDELCQSPSSPSPLTQPLNSPQARVRRALGATRPRPYSSSPSTSTLWPPRNLPDGLYRDVVRSRCKSQYLFYFVSTMYNFCIILQLLLGAALTALGSISARHGLAIVILAAGNTVNAGVVALLHNSGLRESSCSFDASLYISTF